MSLLEALPAPESPEHYVTATRDCVVLKVQTYHLPLDALPTTEFDPDTAEFDETLCARGVLVSEVIKDLEDDEVVTDLQTHEVPAHEVKRGQRWTEDVYRSRKKFAVVTEVYVNPAGHILINGVLHLRDDMVAIVT